MIFHIDVCGINSHALGTRLYVYSAIHTETPGRVDKAAAISALQQSGESYDRVRETLKQVSVDASGKVELEDWVEVRMIPTTLILQKYSNIASELA